MIRTAMIGTIAMSIGLGIGLWLQAGPAESSAQLVSKAKAAGMPAQGCQYCHVSKMPKKEEFKAEDLNERGKWMVAEKDKRKAKVVDAGWLKEYPGGK